VEVDVQPQAGALQQREPQPEVSVVIPCLNEEAAIGDVVREALAGLEAAGVEGEVIVVDNGSEDRSAEVARDVGARVVYEPRRGYGSAYLAGLSAARGTYVVMGDGDGTYDFGTIGSFVERLRGGADMVIGSRFRGTIERGAMPWMNRYVGNPVLTTMLNVFFRCGVSDAHCGLRAVRRSVLPTLKLSSTGMEFASEMVIKAGKRRLRVEEIPIDYRPRVGDSKLSRLGDGWRHVRFMLVHSPTFLFAIPGALATLVGLCGLILLAAMPGLSDPWTGVSVMFAMIVIVGTGVIQLALFSRTYAVIYLGESDEALERGWRRLRLEDGLALAGIVLTIGFTITCISFFDGVPDPRLGILGLTLVAVSFLGAFGAFFLSILGLSEHAILRRKGAQRS
jgi:Glycosyl transferase family 2